MSALQQFDDEPAFSKWESVINGKLPMITLKPVGVLELPHEILVIYGGEKSPEFRRIVARNWGEELAHRGFTFHCFDFQSNVEGNDFYQFGLYDRMVDACQVTRWLLQRPHRYPLTIVGVSMGGHIATQIAAELGEQIRNLVLVAPAAYHDRALDQDVKFSPPGTEFTNPTGAGRFRRILRGYFPDGYWPNGRLARSVFKLAKWEVRSRVLILRFSDDEVVHGIPFKYFDCFRDREGDYKLILTTRVGQHKGNFKDKERVQWILNQVSDFVLEE